MTNGATSSKQTTGSALPKITPHFVWSAVCRWWKWCLPIGLLAGSLAGAYVFFTFVPVYRATAWVRIYANPQYIAFKASTADRRSFIANQVEAIRSPLVLAPVLRDPEVAELTILSKQQDPIDWLKQKITVRAVGRSEYFNIEFTGPNPQQAALITNSVAESYLKFHNLVGEEHTSRLMKLLNERREFHANEVARYRENVRTLSKMATGKDPFGPPLFAESPKAQALAALRTRLVDSIVNRELAEATQKIFQEGNRGPAPISPEMIERAIEEQAAITAMRTEISLNEKKLVEIVKQHVQGTESKPYLQLKAQIEQQNRNLENLIAGLRVQLRNEMESQQIGDFERSGNQLDSSIQRFRAEEDILRERLKGEIVETQELMGNTLELEFAKNELAQATEVLSRIDNRLLAMNTEEKAPDRVELLRDAVVPSLPVAVLPLKNLFIFSLAGLFAPFGLAVAWEFLMRRIHSRAEIEENSSLMVIAEIPDLNANRLGGYGSYFYSSYNQYDRRLGPYEESIDGLRTQIVLSEDLKELQILAVASAVSGEGKTSVSAQLAVSLARVAPGSVLLIDGDLRCPDLHEIFGKEISPGLCEILTGKSEFRDAVVVDDDSHIHFLPAGALATSPHQLMANGRLETLLSQLRSEYRHIVIDTPPVLPASESLNIHKAADGVLVCAMRDSTRMDRFLMTYRRLISAGARPVGAVLNRVSWPQYTSRYGRYDYYKRRGQAVHEADGAEVVTGEIIAAAPLQAAQSPPSTPHAAE